jgi:hypothetical protein
LDAQLSGAHTYTDADPLGHVASNADFHLGTHCVGHPNRDVAA